MKTLSLERPNSTVYGPDIGADLTVLRALLRGVPSSTTPADLIDHPALVEIRSAADPIRPAAVGQAGVGVGVETTCLMEGTRTRRGQWALGVSLDTDAQPARSPRPRE